MDPKDYANVGMTIREALLDQAKHDPPDVERPRHIHWQGLRVSTADAIPVPREGAVRAEILSCREGLVQGFDLKLDGWLMLSDGNKLSLLRTWNDARYDPVVEYPFWCRDGRLWVWNVYKRQLSGGRTLDEKWTENAGLWVERISDTERIYHCSYGFDLSPDFESLIFKITIIP